MADAVTGIIGAVLLAAFLVMIAAKINEPALWIACLSGIIPMLWSLWSDHVAPLLRRRTD